jgi:hypothetical protein
MNGGALARREFIFDDDWSLLSMCLFVCEMMFESADDVIYAI